MSKILLISPERNYPMANEMYPSGALLLLGTILKQAGHEVKIIHQVTDNPGGLEIIHNDFKPDIIGFTVSTFQTKATKGYSEAIKKWWPEIKIVIGGSHPSALKEQVLLDMPHVDIAVIGEGEIPMKLIADGTPLKLIHNIIYREGNIPIANPVNGLIKDLDSLPIPDLSFVDIRKYTGAYPLGKWPNFFVMGSRGCPFRCRFCSHAIYGNTVRYRSVEHVLDEVAYLNSLGIKEVFFQDDTFNYNREWLTDLLVGIIRKGYNKSMRFRAPFRVNMKMVNPGLLAIMKRAGFWLIFYGVESGNQAMLDRMKKGITVEEVKRAFKLTHEAGIKTEASFIIGLPGETPETIQDSINLWKEIKPYWTGFSEATPFPGTPFYQEVCANGFKPNYDNYQPGKIMLPTEAMSMEELNVWSARIQKMMRRDKLGKVLRNPVEAIKYLKK